MAANRVDDGRGDPPTGQALDRTDGTLKTSGDARYAAEFAPPRLVHAVSSRA